MNRFGVDLQASRGDARQIQHIANHTNQLMRAGIYVLQVPTLPFIQRSCVLFDQEFNEATYGVQRLPPIMTHADEDLALLLVNTMQCWSLTRPEHRRE